MLNQITLFLFLCKMKDVFSVCRRIVRMSNKSVLAACLLCKWSHIRCQPFCSTGNSRSSSRSNSNDKHFLATVTQLPTLQPSEKKVVQQSTTDTATDWLVLPKMRFTFLQAAMHTHTGIYCRCEMNCQFNWSLMRTVIAWPPPLVRPSNDHQKECKV